MSVSDESDEDSEKKFDDELTTKKEWKVFNNDLAIYSDEAIDEGTQIATFGGNAIDEEVFEQTYFFESLLKRMYSLRFSYEGIGTSFSEFGRRHELMSKDETINELRRLEEEYTKSRNLTDGDANEDVIFDLIKYSFGDNFSTTIGLSYKDLSYKAITQTMSRVLEKSVEDES